MKIPFPSQSPAIIITFSAENNKQTDFHPIMLLGIGKKNQSFKHYFKNIFLNIICYLYIEGSAVEGCCLK